MKQARLSLALSIVYLFTSALAVPGTRGDMAAYHTINDQHMGAVDVTRQHDFATAAYIATDGATHVPRLHHVGRSAERFEPRQIDLLADFKGQALQIASAATNDYVCHAIAYAQEPSPGPSSNFGQAFYYCGSSNCDLVGTETVNGTFTGGFAIAAAAVPDEYAFLTVAPYTTSSNQHLVLVNLVVIKVSGGTFTAKVNLQGNPLVAGAAVALNDKGSMIYGYVLASNTTSQLYLTDRFEASSLMTAPASLPDAINDMGLVMPGCTNFMLLEMFIDNNQDVFVLFECTGAENNSNVVLGVYGLVWKHGARFIGSQPTLLAQSSATLRGVQAKVSHDGKVVVLYSAGNTAFYRTYDIASSTATWSSPQQLSAGACTGAALGMNGKGDWAAACVNPIDSHAEFYMSCDGKDFNTRLQTDFLISNAKTAVDECVAVAINDDCQRIAAFKSDSAMELYSDKSGTGAVRPILIVGLLALLLHLV